MTLPDRSPADLNALVELAQREQQAGRLAKAAAACRKILTIRPDAAEAHSDLGIILAQQGQLADAAAQFARAIALKPNLPLAHYNLAGVLCQLGRLDEAAAHFEEVIALRPDYPDAYGNLAIVLGNLGKLEAAAARMKQAIALRPNDPEAHNNLGNLLAMQNKLAEAAAEFAQALALRPEYAEPRQNLVVILRAEANVDQARARLEQVLALVPGVAEVHHALGVILAQLGQLEQAAVRFSQAIALRPDYAEAHRGLGMVLAMQSKFDQAAIHGERAVTLRPNSADLHNNLGVVLRQQGRLDEAIERFEQALALKPDYAEAHSNLGNALSIQGKLGDAAAHYRQALSVNPDLAQAELGLAACLLTQGDFERGWPAYEARLRIPGADPLPQLPRWTGQDLTGRSLLLLGDHCLGDTFHFIRYARLLKARGARVVLAVHPALRRFFAGHPDLDEVCPLGPAADLPAADFYVPLLSVPGVLKTNLETIPGEVPYLRADPGLIDRWRERLSQIEGFKIGLAWQAMHETRTHVWRSMPLADFAPLARLSGVRLVSLQKRFGSEQIGQVDFPILDFGDQLDEASGPFMDTAAVIHNLDLVVSIDTSIGHLAGGLGAPVFLALHRHSEWRWLRDRDDSPWYPKTRLFRQKVVGDWLEVAQRIAAAVQALRGESGSQSR